MVLVPILLFPKNLLMVLDDEGFQKTKVMVSRRLKIKTTQKIPTGIHILMFFILARLNFKILLRYAVA
jgi:hypothetical protein